MIDMDPWPDRWIIDDWADSQLEEFMDFHQGRGRLEHIDGFAEWEGPFVDFRIERDATARGPISIVSMTPTSEARFDEDLDMSGIESMLELISPPTRTAIDPGFLINATEGLFRIKAPHADAESCAHPFCAA